MRCLQGKPVVDRRSHSKAVGVLGPTMTTPPSLLKPLSRGGCLVGTAFESPWTKVHGPPTVMHAAYTRGDKGRVKYFRWSGIGKGSTNRHRSNADDAHKTLYRMQHQTIACPKPSSVCFPSPNYFLFACGMHSQRARPEESILQCCQMQ